MVICLLELSVASNLLGVCVHTLSTGFQWYVVLVFTVELVRIFATINRATSGFLHCYLLLEKSVSVSSSSIERQVLSLEKLVPVAGIIIRSLEPLSIASNLISVWVPVCALSTLVHYRRSDLATKLRDIIIYPVARCRIHLLPNHLIMIDKMILWYHDRVTSMHTSPKYDT